MDNKERDKLVAFLGMMGSDQDGEALTAARMAAKFVRERKLTWDQLVSIPMAQQDFHDHLRGSQKAEPKKSSRDEDDYNYGYGQKKDTQGLHYLMATWILEKQFKRLKTKEIAFCQDMQMWRGAATPKQWDWLLSIYQKFEGPMRGDIPDPPNVDDEVDDDIPF